MATECRETFACALARPTPAPCCIDALESSFRAVLQVCTSGGDAATLRVFQHRNRDTFGGASPSTLGQDFSARSL